MIFNNGISSITLTTSGLLHATPVTFIVSAGAASGTMTLVSQAANTAMMGPTSGGAAAPTFRPLVAADIPNISATYSVVAGNSSIVIVGTIGTGVWQGTAVGVTYGGTGANMSATGGTGTFVRQATAGAAFTSSAIVAADIPSGAYTNTQAGAASTPAQTWSGAPYTAGTATTNFPLIFAQTTGATAATSWSTSGTYIGINAASGFAGNFIDFHVNGGTSLFRVSNLGSITFAGSFNMSGSGLTNSYNGTASQSVFTATGTLYTAGTGTTNFPQWFSQPTGTTAVTTWSTAGTVFGANVVSGFTGNFIDFHVAGGTSVFGVSGAGKVTAVSAALTGGPTWSSGSGSPETVVTAPVGSLYSRTDGGASTSLYVKESGAGNTGWVAK